MSIDTVPSSVEVREAIAEAAALGWNLGQAHVDTLETAYRWCATHGLQVPESGPLSGEYAGDWTPVDLLEHVGLEMDTDSGDTVLDSFESAYYEALDAVAAHRFGVRTYDVGIAVRRYHTDSGVIDGFASIDTDTGAMLSVECGERKVRVYRDGETLMTDPAPAFQPREREGIVTYEGSYAARALRNVALGDLSLTLSMLDALTYGAIAILSFR